MTRDIITMVPLDTLIDAATDPGAGAFGSLPIVYGRRLAGILTHSDILEAFIARKQRGGSTI
jgi:CBS domain-containing protein